MPHYDYKCRDCGYKFERFHSMSEEMNYCPKCNGYADKLISQGCGVIIKGTNTLCKGGRCLPGVKKLEQ